MKKITSILTLFVLMVPVIWSQDTVTDIDGNVYETVQIGEQVWMKENLKVTHYRNGDEIPTGLSYGYGNGEWVSTYEGAYAVYNDNPANADVYGNLYNWYAVETGNLAPEGWHVPSDAEWTALISYLDADADLECGACVQSAIAGGILKATGTIEGGDGLWFTPNEGATNESGFTGLPGGYRDSYDGSYGGMGNYAIFWSSTEYTSSNAWFRSLRYDNSTIIRSCSGYYVTSGFPVRCVRDEIQTGTIIVPQDYPTIQAGIDAVSDGDTVLVSAGTYYENINYNGKNISVIGENRETTIINGNQSGSVVTFENWEDSTAVLSGFTITNGNSVSGGGISCTYSAPTIDNLIIVNNHGNNNGGAIFINHSVNPLISNCFISGNSSNENGGGLSIFNSSPNIVNTEIRNNQSSSDGGGIRWFASTPTLRNVVIVGNSSARGGGLSCWDFSNSLISNVVIYDNTASVSGGALLIRNGSHPVLTNSILWDNYPQQVSFDNSFSVNEITIKYTDFQGGIGSIIGSNGNINYLDGNIDSDPFFTNPENGDFTLQSTSPCIDAGDPNGELDPDGTIVDMGAYYFHQTLGCTDPFASNYNPDANVDDGSCEYTPIGGPHYALEFDSQIHNGIIIPDMGYFNELSILAKIKFFEYNGDINGIIGTTIGGENGSGGDGGIDIQIKNISDGEYHLETIGHCGVSNHTGSYDYNFNFDIWYDFAVTVSNEEDRRTIKLYVNGVEKSSEFSYGMSECNISLNGNMLGFGKQYGSLDSPRYFNGSMDYFAIFDIELSAAEVASLSNSNLNTFENLDALSFWKMEEGVGSTINDYSISNQNNLIINEGISWIGDIIYGCTNPIATNFDPEADIDDGSCEYYEGPTWHVSTTGSDSNDGSEESPFATIQHGIDVSSDGDTVSVTAGTYVENINFNGKNISVIGEDRETTIIDGNQNGSVVTLESGEDNTTALSGFTIQNGSGTLVEDGGGWNELHGGGMLCYNSNPTIKYLKIIDNGASFGGGVTIINSNPFFEEVIISDNNGGAEGGGIFCRSGDPILKNVIIQNNDASVVGGGIKTDGLNCQFFLNNVLINNNYGGGYSGGRGVFTNVTIVNNVAGGGSAGGGGISWSDIELINSIVYGNLPSQISEFYNSTVTYSDIQDGWEGEENIDSNPLFTDPDNGDYTLQSTSPCIDAGDPNSDYDPDGTIADMGAYYFDQIDNPLPVSDEISLLSGWNLISFDIDIENNATTDVFADFITSNNLIGATGYDNGALFYDPDLPPFINTLTEINAGSGYYVKLYSSDEISHVGMPLNLESTIDIDAGWNLISYWLQDSQSPADAFAELITADIFIGATGYDNGALFFDPLLPPFLNSLTSLDNGFGYWVKLNEAVEGFQYPEPTTVLAKTAPRETNPDIAKTNVFMFVNGSVAFDHIDYTVGDMVNITTGSGLLVGEMEILKDGYLMTGPIYGDDLTTEAVDGAIKDEALVFSYNEYISEPIDLSFNGNMELSRIDLTFKNVPQTFSLHQNYPNPFNPITSLRYDLPEQAQVTLTVYDMLGREVAQLVNTTQESGFKAIQWNATDTFGKPVSAGVYLYQIRAGEFVQTKKMVLLK